MNDGEKAVPVPAQGRKGEKVGWIGGWIGSFAWVLVFVVLKFVRGGMVGGVLGLLLFLLAMAFILMFAPWRHPTTRYYLLMLPIYVVFLVSVGWVIWSMGGFVQSGLQYWNLLLVFPLLSPFITIGWKRWCDGEPPNM